MSKYIILVSDSHRQTECLKEIREMYPNAYAYLHAGDSELPKQLTEGYACVQVIAITMGIMSLNLFVK